MKRKGATKTSTEASVPMFIRVKPDTQKWLKAEACRTGHFMGHVLDVAVAAIKAGKKYKLSDRVMKTLEKFKTQHENRLKRYKE